MKESISIQKTVYINGNFREIIDTNFSELSSTKRSFTQDEFFEIYNELFLQLPLTGPKSHEALINKSRQLFNAKQLEDPKDIEIRNLQNTIFNLEKQALKSTEDTTTIKEHPLFPNGSIIGRSNENGSGIWPDAYYMDQGYKRAILFSGDSEMWGGFKTLKGYDNREVPKFPNFVIDNIPSGKDLSKENINDRWTPSEFLKDSETLRITLDPTDAKLDLNSPIYNGDVNLWRNELEKDFSEKTNYINALEDKIKGIISEIQKIRGY